MRLVLAPLAFLCLFAFPAHAQSHGGPDSIYVPGSGYVNRGDAGTKAQRAAHPRRKPRAVSAARMGARSARHAGTTVAGRTFTPSPAVSFHSSAAPWLSEARRHVGTNPTGKRSLWCADFVNLALERTGRNGTNSRAAKSFLSHGRRLSAPRPGAIAVYHRRGGGHVAIVERVEGNTVTLVSGNCGRKGVCVYSRPVSAAIAYVWPS